MLFRSKARFPGFDAELTKVNKKKPVLTNEVDTNNLVNGFDKEFLIQSVENKDRKRESKPPFITSTLQQEASIKINFSSQKTMLIAQKLYEGIDLENETVGLITYMRTDSYRISNEFTAPAINYVNETYGEEYAQKPRKLSNKKNVQDAHESIRPTNVELSPSFVKKYLSRDEFLLYEMIYLRTISHFMKPTIINGTAVILSNNGSEFKANAQSVSFDGYLKAYGKYEKVELSELDRKSVV